MTSMILPQRPAFCISHSSQVIASTYQLDSDSNSRAGSLYFLDTKDLSSLRAVPTPAGVFRFEIVGDSVVSALTDGSLHYVSLTDLSTKTVKVADDMLLNVSVSGKLAAVTTNKGEVFVIDYPSGTVVSSWLGHKLPYTSEPCEVWSVALSGNQLCTGGEDSFLTFWDPRGGAQTGCCKIFDAGVTYLRWRDDHLLLTGSYDQKIRLLDSRNLREAVTETKTPGGVWHIESLGEGPSERHLAACMYGGFVILDSDWNLVFQNEEAGKELLYGVTFADPSTVVYTTFNDYRVSIHSIA